MLQWSFTELESDRRVLLAGTFEPKRSGAVSRLVGCTWCLAIGHICGAQLFDYMHTPDVICATMMASRFFGRSRTTMRCGPANV